MALFRPITAPQVIRAGLAVFLTGASGPGTPAPALPDSVNQALIAYRGASSLAASQPRVQGIAALLPAATQTPPAVVPQLGSAPWPYAVLEAWRLQPEPATFAGISAIYLAPPPVRTLPAVVWPYTQVVQFGPEPAVIQPAASQTPPGSVAQLTAALWPYAQTEQWRLQPEPATFAGISAIYLAPPPVRTVTAGVWPYTQVAQFAPEPAAVIPAPAAQLAPPAVAQPGAAPWPYSAVAQFGPEPAATQPVAASVPPAPMLQPVAACWPYAASETWRLQPEPATFAGVSAISLPRTPVCIVPPQPWPYARFSAFAPMVTDYTYVAAITLGPRPGGPRSTGPARPSLTAGTRPSPTAGKRSSNR